MLAKAATVGVLSTADEDVRSLRSIITLGLKGMAAYVKHADVLGKHDPAVDAFLQETLAKTLDDSLGVADLVALTLETGSKGVAAMALLDAANTEAYGHPEITKVNIGTHFQEFTLVGAFRIPHSQTIINRQPASTNDTHTGELNR